MALTGSVTMAWLSLYGFAWNDYETEARPAFEALAHGHLLGFLRLVPAYGGSLLLRAPFALLPSAWGGGELAVYRAVAVPGLLAGAALGIYLVARLRAAARPLLWRAVALGLCVANPLTLRALELGHPEELLGAAMCIAAVFLADREHPWLAGLMLGAAIANKEWALLALGPVLLVLPSRRSCCLLACGAMAAALTAPIALVSSGAFVAGARGAASPSSAIFQPMQIFWFLGHHSPAAGHLLGPEKHDFRLAPGWIGRISHPLVIAVALPLSWIAWRAREPTQLRRTGLAEGLLLLALLLLLRCMLDTWDNVYYPLPFVLALLAWETEQGRPALLALLATALVWANGWLSLHVSADAQAAFFLIWSLPLSGALALKLLRRDLKLPHQLRAPRLTQPVTLRRAAH
jgi:hypothetical protein